MSEEIIKVLDNLSQKFGLAIDWSNQNILPYLQELMTRFITYRNITGITQIIIYIIAIILLSIGIKLLINWRNSEGFDKGHWSDDPFTFWFCITLIIVAMSIFIGLIIGNIFGIIQNMCMPEITIIKYLTTMM